MSDNFGNLQGLRAVVTGASSGIGRAIAREFVRGGADVIVHARSSLTALEELADEFRQENGKVEILMADLADESQRAALVENSYRIGAGVDVWVNNAGVDLLTGEAADLPYEEKLARLLEVDVAATISLSKAVGGRMQQHGSGTILNIGWDQSDRGMGGDSGELFSTAKNAIMGFTRSLAVSLSPTVRVNCIAPGWIRTAWGDHASEYWQNRVVEETPLKRWGTPEDIAYAARFFCSPQASYITGQVVNINGGAVR